MPSSARATTAHLLAPAIGTAITAVLLWGTTITLIVVDATIYDLAGVEIACTAVLAGTMSVISGMLWVAYGERLNSRAHTQTLLFAIQELHTDTGEIPTLATAVNQALAASYRRGMVAGAERQETPTVAPKLRVVKPSRRARSLTPRS